MELFTVKVGIELKISVPIPLGRTDVNRLKCWLLLKVADPMEESAFDVLNDDNLLYRDYFVYSVCNIVLCCFADSQCVLPNVSIENI